MKYARASLLLCLILFAGCKPSSKEIYTIEHYQYPITLTDPNWSEYENTEIDEMLKIPDATLQEMTTNALIQAILEHPKLCELPFYDHDGNGFDAGDIAFYHLESYYAAIKELRQRSDGEKAAKTFGLELLNEYAKKNLSEYDSDSMEFLQLYAINVDFPRMISAIYPNIKFTRIPKDIMQPGIFFHRKIMNLAVAPVYITGRQPIL